MSSRFFGLIPAAGLGTRFGGGGPKQYARIATKSMLQFAVEALLSAPDISKVFVVLAPEDEEFRRLEWGAAANRIAPLYCGGATRRDSVLNGLVAAQQVVDPEDWVLVHDAARPCLDPRDLRRLIDEVTREAVGGLLAVPVADTLKRANEERRVIATEPRQGLWQAQTPQMFRYGSLRQALTAAVDVTDESSAVERLGVRPRLVEGSQRNLKVTYASDLALAQAILSARRGE
jgi:2-C-methyl-D-erythritol 4-phosphate cytidylyltransferase